MPRKKENPRPAPRSGFEQAWENLQAQRATQTGPPPTVSARWLAKAVALVLLAAAACAWGALCLLFWQGSWQLLYHPTTPITRTPASPGMPFETVGFAATPAGEARLEGWWIPAAPGSRYARYTVLFLHGQDGNLSDTVDSLTSLHLLGLNVFVFDYRGYGKSHFEHPSEARWREDTEWALRYLTSTRGVPASSILLDGRALGANLALEIAASHPELAGVIVEEPVANPMQAIFADPRAALVPAHLLVDDRWAMDEAAKQLQLPALWFAQTDSTQSPNQPRAFATLTSPKMLVWVVASASKEHDDALTRWLDELHSHR